MWDIISSVGKVFINENLIVNKNLKELEEKIKYYGPIV